MKKRREIITWVLVFLALAVFILLVFPYQKQISYHGTDYEYSADDPSMAAPHEVVIEGTYIHYLLFDDVFQGTFYISDIDIDATDTGKNVYFKFDYQCCSPSFLDEVGQPVFSKVSHVFAEPNFTQLAIQFYEAIEYRDDGKRIVSVSLPGGTFLVPGAKARDKAYETYLALLRASGMIE